MAQPNLLQSVLTPAIHHQAVNIGLLILRVWFALAILALHGWNKLAGFSSVAERFPDVLGIGAPAFQLSLVIVAEVVAAALLAVGLFSRYAAGVLVINLSVAYLLAHGARLSGQGNGELAFVYLGAFLTLLVTGPGLYSLDARLFGASAAEPRTAHAVPASS